jgi:hypothetical protein
MPLGRELPLQAGERKGVTLQQWHEVDGVRIAASLEEQCYDKLCATSVN